MNKFFDNFNVKLKVRYFNSQDGNSFYQFCNVLDNGSETRYSSL